MSNYANLAILHPFHNTTGSNLGSMKKVSDLDFTRLKHKMTDTSEAKITSDEWDSAEIEYRRFLMLKQIYPGVSLVPSKQVDNIWHAHILDTRAYREDCDSLFGRFIDHYPYFGIYGNDDQANLKHSFDQTKELYERHFGPYPTKTIVSRCQDHSCHAPSECACRSPGACK